jgi:hypothetical protein
VTSSGRGTFVSIAVELCVAPIVSEASRCRGARIAPGRPRRSGLCGKATAELEAARGESIPVVPGLRAGGSCPRVLAANGRASFGRPAGGVRRRVPRATPFFLERANPSRGGGAKPRACGFTPRILSRRSPGCRREWAVNACPSLGCSWLQPTSHPQRRRTDSWWGLRPDLSRAAGARPAIFTPRLPTPHRHSTAEGRPRVGVRRRASPFGARRVCCGCLATPEGFRAVWCATESLQAATWDEGRLA